MDALDRASRIGGFGDCLNDDDDDDDELTSGFGLRRVDGSVAEEILS